MSDKIKDYSLIIISVIIIFGTLLINMIVEDEKVSKTERKSLQQFPEITWKSIEDKSFMNKFETYTTDQFVGRDDYRKIKAYMAFNVFKHSDNNDIYIVDGQVSEFVSKLNDNAINTSIKGYNHIYESMLKDSSNVYFALIPDKNYFIAESNGYPSIDYKELKEKFKNNLNSNIKYIDLFDSLTIDDYYKTDIHWRQEKIDDVVSKLSKEMNFKTGNIKYTENILKDFYGVYYGKSALPIDSEDLIYYTSEDLSSVKVKLLNEKYAALGKVKFDEIDMYNLEGYIGTDPYDIFLHGPKQLIVIENKNASSDRELVIFRDSFTSSLAPLLVESYKKITLVDLRYIANILLTDEMVEFKENQDVLILNCIDVLNSGTIKFFDESGKLIK